MKQGFTFPEPAQLSAVLCWFANFHFQGQEVTRQQAESPAHYKQGSNVDWARSPERISSSKKCKRWYFVSIKGQKNCKSNQKDEYVGLMKWWGHVIE
jgi:hypothetical protein